MKVTCKEGSCFLGRTLDITDGKTTLSVTIDVGPRIINLSKVGGENIMYHDVDDNVNHDSSAIYGEGKVWHIYGGHRIWLSPEEEKTYVPDSTPVKYEITETGAIFTPDKWAVHDVQTGLEIAFKEDGSIDVKMTAKNESGNTKKLCIWALTVLKCGAELTVPLSTEDTGYLANRNIVHWHYNDVNDSRYKLYNDKFILKSSNKATGPMKIGTYLKDFKTIYRYGDTTFIKSIDVVEGEYPDFCCNLETYTNRYIHEVESLSPLVDVKDGETLTHVENWRVE